MPWRVAEARLNRRDLRTIIAALLVLAAVVATGSAVLRSRFFQIDACLDRGRCWDYCNNRCSDDNDRCQACEAN